MNNKSKYALYILAAVIVSLVVFSVSKFISSKQSRSELESRFTTDIKPQPSLQKPTEKLVKIKVISQNPPTNEDYAEILQYEGNYPALPYMNERLLSIGDDLCARIDTPQAIQSSYGGTIWDENKKETLTDSEKIEAMKARSISSDMGMKTEYISNHIISISSYFDYYCGGAYPDHYASGINFVYDKKINTDAVMERTSPYTITFYHIFTDYASNMGKIYAILADEIAKDSQEGCFEADSASALDQLGMYGEEGYFSDPISFYITKDALVIQGMGLPHVMAACEPVGLAIPWSRFGNMISPEFLKELE